MRIGIEVNDFFGNYGSRTGKFEMDVKPGFSVQNLLEILNIPLDKVGFVIVNQKRVDCDYVFSEGDSVHVLPFATGG
ncbi:sulfur carrier protein ThiS [Caldicoprobacter guelmensis]|uniref:MoaD/ThiS family protein n=1 Tax=Caldicoprobacter guelmensis TaxID=1170224 RepID=UPI00195B19BA|nr:MoaD/ThiS family protein [Caldicoprobacter guelmensis]MBM7582763.1 sulfur carrier protein ThiS [Caldicoprobacter guelmensis]